MNLNLGEEQQMLQDMVSRVCRDLCDSAAVRQAEASEDGWVEPLWRQLGSQGLTGLSIAEAHGGSGAGLLSLAVMYEQLGRVLAPTPHWVSCVLAGELLEASATACELAGELLPRLATGEIVASVAWVEPGGSADCRGIQLAAVPGAKGEALLSGEKILVPYAGIADWLILLVRAGKGIEELGLVLLPTDSPGLSWRAQLNHAGESLFAVHLDQVEIPTGHWLEQGPRAWQHWQQAMDRAGVALAAQAVGATEAVLEMTVDYARQRHAFGQPIGSFQAIAHYLADVATELESARIMTWQAACAWDAGGGEAGLSAMARLHAGEVFQRATTTAVQVHGGMGFSLEADPQLYFRRARQWRLLHWDPDWLERRIVDSVLGSGMARHPCEQGGTRREARK